MTSTSWQDSLCVPPRNDRYSEATRSFFRSFRGRGLLVLAAVWLLAESHAAAQGPPTAVDDQTAAGQTQVLAAQSQSAPPQGQPPAAQQPAAGQQQPPPVEVTSPAAGPYPLPAQLAGLAVGEWQIAEAYQFNRISLAGTLPPFNTIGFNSSVVWFFGRDIGVEGDLGAGFGSPPGHASAASIFVGAGPRIALRGRHHFEPWGHGLVGVQHFSFGGVNFPMNSSSLAWVAGGGVDYHFNSGLGLRVQADYLGSRFGGAFQRNLQVVTGIVWNF